MAASKFYDWRERYGKVNEHNVILERAKELHQEVRPRIISDNGPQFIAKDFKECHSDSDLGRPTSELRPIILNRTERLNAGTNRS